MSSSSSSVQSINNNINNTDPNSLTPPFDLEETIILGLLYLAFFTSLNICLPILTTKISAFKPVHNGDDQVAYRISALIYSTVVIFWSSYVLFDSYYYNNDNDTSPVLWQSPATPPMRRATLFTLVYFGYDTFAMVFLRKKRMNWPLFVHHVFSLRYASIACVQCLCGPGLLWGTIIAESSNPQQHLKFLLKAYGYQDSKLTNFLSKTWLPLYFLSRSVVCPIAVLSHDFWHFPTDIVVALMLFSVAAAKTSVTVFLRKRANHQEVWWKDYEYYLQKM